MYKKVFTVTSMYVDIFFSLLSWIIVTEFV